MSTDVFVRGSGTPGAGRRRWTGPVLAVLVLVLTVVVLYEPPSTGTTYDPASRTADGLAVLVDVLREMDVEVRIEDALPAVGAADAVLAPPLGWFPDELLALAEDGTRVVAVLPPDPEAEQVQLAFTGVGLVTREVDCAALPDVSSLRSTAWVAWQPPVGSLPEDARRCVTGDGGGAWLTEVPVGEGELVALGTFAPLINDRMRDQDAAVAAVGLLAVASGDTVVALTVPGQLDASPTLFDIIDDRWFDAAWLTLLVLVLAAAARGRRLGRPVSEELPVRVSSGELARATGDLRHRIGAHGAAIEELRTRTLALAGARLGLGASPDGEAVVDAMRTAGLALEDADAHVLLTPATARADDESLTGAATRLAGIRDTLRGGAAPANVARDRADTPPPSPTDAPEQP